MRRYIIYGLMGLLLVVVFLDFRGGGEIESVASISTPVRVITATPGPIANTPRPTTEASPTISTDSAISIVATQAEPELRAADGIRHSIRSGDTLFNLAQQYGTSITAISEANGIDLNATLFVGQVLLIPGAAASLSEPVEPALPAQVVASNENVSDVAPAPPAEPPTQINGLAYDSIIIMPEPVKQHVREIFALGQSMGNNAHAFSKLGDSTIEAPFFLTRFDSEDYRLGDYVYLQAVIDYFAGSFAHNGVTIRRGLHTWSVLDPMWAPKPTCAAGENMLACEFRLNKPSVLFIRLGSNDAGIPETTEKNLREIIEFTLSNGVIPILGTKADRAEGPSNINNEIIRRVASDYLVPLWDYDLIAGTIPGRGLTVDNVHMTTFYAHDYTQPEAFQRGASVHNLSALVALDMVWRVFDESGS